MTDLRLALERLHENLVEAAEAPRQAGSENHWTAKTWLLFFENRHIRCVFDTTGTAGNHRPDIQVWFGDNGTSGPDLWVEAKASGSFENRQQLKNALIEVKDKLESCIRNGDEPPTDVMLTDFQTHLIFDCSAFIRALEEDVPQSRLLNHLGTPKATWKTARKNAFIEKVKQQLQVWQREATQRTRNSAPLDLDGLIAELLGAATSFRRDHIEDVCGHLGRGRLKRLFEEWLEAGGNLTVHMVNPSARKLGVGADQAFAELCFHTVMVRFFVVKWFIDHRLISGTQCASAWSLLGPESSSETLRKCLAPEGDSPGERLIRSTFRPTDVYLWILDVVPSPIWNRIRSAFHRYSLAAERTDILGEFYQKYMRLYERREQMLLGQFYTPHTLTRAMWKLAGGVLRVRNISLSDDSCLVIDPCVGTGTFLNQGLRLLLDGSWGATRRRYSGAELSAVARRFSGFEVNPLSRGVAVVNCLTEMLAHTDDGCASFNARPRIFETNAYDVPDLQQPELFRGNLGEDGADWADFQAWRQETLEASEAKKKSQYRIVIGNPPWRNPSPACKDTRLKGLLQTEIMPWAWEYEGHRLSEIRGCNHGIRDDYAFFLGLAIRLLADRGLLVFVTNESWLAQPTYTMLRRYMLDHLKIHAVVRVGPYFDGVQERAAVLVAEKMPAGVDGAGRDQTIKYLDWSDLSNPEWNQEWINRNLDRVIQGTVRATEWTDLKPVEGSCAIRVVRETLYKNQLPSCVSIPDLFEDVKTGAQSGCGPLLLGRDVRILERRVRMLFRGETDQLIDAIYEDVRGGRDAATDLVETKYAIIQKDQLRFDRNAIRPILAHFPSSEQAQKHGLCYFDARLWLFPRTPRVGPNRKTLWDFAPKMALRDMYDPDDKVAIAAVDLKGLVIDNHFFNGGTNVVGLLKEDGSSNLTEVGAELRALFVSDEDFLFYISAVINSPQVQDWTKANPGERVHIPTRVDRSIARRMAKLEKARMPDWQRDIVDDTASHRQDEKVGLLFEKALKELNRTA